MTPRCLPFFAYVLATLFGVEGVMHGQERTSTPMRGVNRGQPQPTKATLLIGVNETAGNIAEPGWPLIVSASRAPDEQFASVPLPANLKLKLTTETGGDVALTLTPVPPAAKDASNTLYWVAAEDATARLPIGRLRLDAIAGQPELSTWRVEIGELHLVTPDPANARLLTLLKAHRSVLLGKEADAIAEVDRLIAANVEDQHAWIAKGDILMKRDLPDEALQAYDKALALHKKTEREPIAIQIRRRSAFFRSLEKRGVLPPGNPAP